MYRSDSPDEFRRNGTVRPRAAKIFRRGAPFDVGELLFSGVPRFDVFFSAGPRRRAGTFGFEFNVSLLMPLPLRFVELLEESDGKSAFVPRKLLGCFDFEAQSPMRPGELINSLPPLAVREFTESFSSAESVEFKLCPSPCGGELRRIKPGGGPMPFRGFDELGGGAGVS